MLALAGLAVLLAGYDSAILVLGLPGIAAEFQAPVPQLSELGSVLALGALGALPLAALADVAGRRRVLAVAVLGFSLIDAGSALAPSLAWLAAARLVGVCFETATAGVATALVVEEMPGGRRALAVSTLTLAAGLGIGKFSREVERPPASLDSTEMGFNVGGGVTYALSDRAWVRGDVRFFKHIDELPSVWRFAGGITLRVGP